MSHKSRSVQTSYDINQANGLPGTVADQNPCFKDTFVAEEPIPFGRVISRGSTGNVRGGARTARLGNNGQLPATAGYADGTGNLETDLGVWQGITDGSFKITLGDPEVAAKTQDVTGLDFNAVTDLDGVAAVIQAALQAIGAGGADFTSATCEIVDGHIRITNGTTGVDSKVSDAVAVEPATGTDIHVLMGFDTANNVDGQDATTLILLGVSVRHVVHQAVAGVENSGDTVVPVGEIGAVLYDGRIKVLAS